MNCSKDDADNLTECSLKPGPKGDKGCLGDQVKEGSQGMNGESKATSATLVVMERRVQRVPSAIPAQWVTEGIKEMWAR